MKKTGFRLEPAGLEDTTVTGSQERARAALMKRIWMKLIRMGEEVIESGSNPSDAESP